MNMLYVVVKEDLINRTAEPIEVFQSKDDALHHARQLFASGDQNIEYKVRCLPLGIDIERIQK